MVKARWRNALPVVLSLVLLLASCGGGGGTSSPQATVQSVTPLTVVKKVSVVDPQTGEASNPAGIASARPSGVTPLAIPTDPASDYAKDEPNVYVEERSVESFNTVNQILCMVAQTGYGAMLNQGPYKAQVDLKACEGKDSASAGGQQSANQSSGANSPEYALWTVDVSRADDFSPQIVKVWVHEPGRDNEPERLIYAKVTVDEGVSASNPLGIFTLNFEGHAAPGGVPDPEVEFSGVLKTERDANTGKVFLKFYDAGGYFDPSRGDVTTVSQVILDRNPDGSSGTGTLYNGESFSGAALQAVAGTGEGSYSTMFDIAFDNNYFLRDDGMESICFDRKNFDSSGWSYGLYHDNGARVNRNSGFPVSITRSGTEYQGWIGYYGSWFPNDLALEDGETVVKQAYGSGGTSEQYVATVRNGKLKKRIRRVLTLADVVSVPLELHEFDQQSGTDNQYRVLWNGTDFRKVASMDRNNWTWRNITPVPLDLSELRYSELFFWSQSLGGSVQVKLEDCAPDTKETQDPSDDTFACAADNGTPVVSYSEVAVTPDDAIPDTLACFENCPEYAKIAAADPNPFAGDIQGYQPVPPSSPSLSYMEYTFGAMVLREGGNGIVSTNAVYEYGLMSGPLFEPTAGNLELLRCEFDTDATCGWQAGSSLPEYYTWETGPNAYNKFTGLQRESDGSFVSLDPPLSVEYVHTGGGYTNARFYLEYNGFGNLHGIPGKCVDMETGEDADCSGGDGFFIRWVPEFTIPDGSAATSGGTDYYVKAMEIEQRMTRADASACSGAGLATSSYQAQLPTSSDYTAPGIGAEPEVTGPPAVVGGVVQ